MTMLVPSTSNHVSAQSRTPARRGLIPTVFDEFRSVPTHVWLLYFAFYLTLGLSLQLTAPYTRIARFAYDWQVLTIYGCYLVPLSILVRRLPWHGQYAYSVIAIGPIDVIGFALGTSQMFPENVISQVFGPQSFTLCFVLIAAWIPALGNLAVARLVPIMERLPWAARAASVSDKPADLEPAPSRRSLGI